MSGWPYDAPASEFAGRKLQVFIMPHSHNDPGWIKTVEEYFRDQTRGILDNIVEALSAVGSKATIRLFSLARGSCHMSL